MKKPAESGGQGLPESVRRVDNPRMKATRDGDTFTLQGKHWIGTYRMDELPGLLDWYRGQRAKFPKAGNSYDSVIEAMEGLLGAEAIFSERQ